MPPAALRILIDGEEIREDANSRDAVVGRVEAVQVLNQHYWCTIELRQTPDMRPPVEKWIGKDLKLHSTNQDAGGQVMFAGFVLDVKLEYEITGSYRAFLTGVSYSYKLDLTPRREYHAVIEEKKAKSKKLDEIAQKIASRVGLKADVADAQGVQPPLAAVQWAETDWHFLWRLCDDFGYYLHPTNDGFKITKGFKPAPVSLTWRTEWGLSSFTIGAHLAQPAMAGCHYDYTESVSETYKEQEVDSVPFTGAIEPLRAAMRAESKKLPPGYVYWRNRVSKVAEYQSMLKAESRIAVGSKFDCHGVSQLEKVTPGTPVLIDGVIDGEGQYNVHSVAHHWDQIGYSNSFWCTPWMDYRSSERPQRPFVSGVYSARVVDIDDPERRGEVRVQYFWQEENETGWIRHLSSYAGEDRGIFFRPELGDEVMVGFEEGDPERPVIVGSTWNKTDGTPSEDFWGEETKDNDVKRIVTKSGHRISMVDKKGKQSIVIATPQNLKMSLLENADETGRPAFLLHAAQGDIILSAPNGRVHFQSQYFSREVGSVTGVVTSQPSGTRVGSTSAVKTGGAIAVRSATTSLATAADGSGVDALVKSIKDEVHRTDWAQPAEKTATLPNGKELTFEKDKPKCNLFVYEMLKRNGLPAPVDDEGKELLTAHDWADRTKNIPGYKIVPRAESCPGDIVAVNGTSKKLRDKHGELLHVHHVGFVSGPNETTSAGADEVHQNNFGFDDDKYPDPIFRKFVGFGESKPAD